MPLLIWELENRLSNPISNRMIDFTVFAEAKIEFSPKLNVIIGDNATGKTHLLKLGYSVMHTLSRKEKLSNAKKALANKLYQVFKTKSLGHLTRHGHQRTEVTTEMGLADTETLKFSYTKNNRTEVTLDQTITATLPNHAAVFIPTREVFTLHPEITALYEERYMTLDETHYDLCKALNLPLLKRLPQELNDIMLKNYL